MIGAHLRVGNAREDRELIPEIAQDFHIVAGLVVPPALLGKERGAVESEARADEDHPVRRGFPVSQGQAFQSRKRQDGGSGAKEVTA